MNDSYHTYTHDPINQNLYFHPAASIRDVSSDIYQHILHAFVHIDMGQTEKNEGRT